MLRPLLIHQHPQRPSSVSSVLGDSTPPSTLLAIFVALEPTPHPHPTLLLALENWESASPRGRGWWLGAGVSVLTYVRS